MVSENTHAMWCFCADCLKFFPVGSCTGNIQRKVLEKKGIFWKKLKKIFGK